MLIRPMKAAGAAGPSCRQFHRPPSWLTSELEPPTLRFNTHYIHRRGPFPEIAGKREERLALYAELPGSWSRLDHGNNGKPDPVSPTALHENLPEAIAARYRSRSRRERHTQLPGGAGQEGQCRRVHLQSHLW